MSTQILEVIPQADNVEHTERVLRAHGGGGELMNQLIRDHLLPLLGNERLNALTDGAVLPSGKGSPVLTTDGFVVQPLEFPGGDIGKLAVCGTVNDVAMMGATPTALTLSLILDEGLPLEMLDRIAVSIAATAKQAGVQIVSGDTKVVEAAGREPGLFVTTTGLGYKPDDVDLGYGRIEPGDRLLINGPIAEHGLAIMAVREGLEFETRLRSDAAPLNGLVAALLELGPAIKFLRDPTRGGVANVLADLCEETGLSVEVEEPALPITPTARHAAELLGLDPLTVANEGKLVAVVSAEAADDALRICREHEHGERAALFGTISAATPNLIELLTTSGGRRIVQRPYGEELPRIC